ncbi:hypothetical protein A190_gp101 [European catfish virus]|uniref:Transmembrane protein n=1 Tax=European catfish virus TaxID=84739 RepID=I2BFT1_9VIRU|nr:hypothetical protein A190_gp101 [European catfish virus]AFJ52384.1 hypothetical protein [European catfish virus]
MTGPNEKERGFFLYEILFVQKKDIAMIRALCTIVLIAAGAAVALYLSLVYGYYESFGVPDASWLTALTGDRPDAEVPFFDKAVGEAPEDKAAYTERPYPVSSTQSPTTTQSSTTTTTTTQSPTTTTTLKPTTMAVLASIGATPTPVVCHDVRGDMPGIGCDDLVAMGFTVLRREGLPQRGYHTVVMKKHGANRKWIPYITSVKTNPRRGDGVGGWHIMRKKRSPAPVGVWNIPKRLATAAPDASDANKADEPEDVGAWHIMRKKRSVSGTSIEDKKTVAAAPKVQPEAKKDDVNALYGTWHLMRRRRSPFGVWNIPKKLATVAPDV